MPPPETASTVHRPVMASECLRELALSPGMTAVDGTAGGGGHLKRIAHAVGPDGRVFAFDRDPAMIARARATLGEAPQVEFICSSYVALGEFLAEAAEAPVDAILLDLGLSSDQLADEERGFGFQTGGPLDLRFDSTGGLPASDWLATSTDEVVAKALLDFGDLPPSSPLSRAVVKHRARLKTTEALASLAIDVSDKRSKSHPATVVLQALRIAVNEELQHVERAVTEVFPNCLRPGGRLVILTFHSIEDRIVKKAFQNKEVWTCQQKKPILPRPAEVRDNPRTRSAKLRVATRNTS